MLEHGPGARAEDARPSVDPRLEPASIGQASLWYLRQVMPYKSPYNTAVQLRLVGEIDEQALVACVREISRRHESFRTTFTTVEGTVVQAIHETMQADVALVDVAAFADPRAEANRVARAAASEAFDLVHGPLVRVRLLRIGRREHSLVVVLDHIVVDGMSLAILWREIEALYPAFLAGQPSPLPPVRKQFTACVDAQNTWLKTPAFARALDYWTDHLQGAAPCDLPTDRPRPPVKSYRGGFVRDNIPAPVVARLRAMSVAEDVSVFAVLLTALQVLLARYSGQTDISVLVPVAGRQRFAAEHVFGYFANMLVLRTPVPDESTFRDLLRQVNAEIVRGVLRQDVPFEKVIERMRPQRTLSHDPLASVGISFLPANGSKLDLPGVEATFEEVPNGGSKFDLHFFIAEVAGDFTCCAEYNNGIFEQGTVERLLSHYRVVLEAALADPTRVVGELPLLSRDEERRILTEWNATEVPVPPDETVHGLVTAASLRTPDASAASFDGREVTYAELSRRSNQVARSLQARGVGPNVLVGIAVERSLEMLIGALGILKAGGAYVPLDPGHPRDRLALVAEDSGLRVLLTQSSLAHLAPSAKAVLRFDGDSEEIAGMSGDPLPGRGDPGSLAYVIYTSGSTGRPKGVPITHRSVVSFLHSMAKRPGMSASDRLLSVISLAFDMAGFELWLPLMVGAHVEIASRETLADGSLLRRRLEGGRDRTRITVMQATPSTFRMLLETGWKGDKGLKIVVGGEALSSDLSERLLEHAGSLWNGYGPTETTIFSTMHQMEKGAPVLIGRPIDNTQIYILDRNLRPVPIGVPGEIFIGGVGVARGYLGRPELTRERFIPDTFSRPASGESAPLLYKTGDLARYRVDGAIDYLGRNDFQVKLRGYRIELGEIETTLVSHRSIREAVVTTYDEGGDKRLVAYVTLRDGGALPEADVRALLRAKLPEYMVPARFMVLDRLPLNTNNKIDRKALPPPTRSTTTEGSTAVGPRDDVEAKVVGIFREVLGLREIGVKDSFFDLGGHSLLALRLVSRIEKAFGQRLPMSALLTAPSPADIAELIRSHSGGLTTSLVAISARGARSPVYWLPGGGGISVLAFRGVSQMLGANQPVYGLEARVDDPDAPVDVRGMAARYIRDIQAFQPRGPYHLMGFSSGSWVAFEMARKLREQGQEVGLLVVFDTQCWIGAKSPTLDRLRIRMQRERYNLKHMPRTPSGIARDVSGRLLYALSVVQEQSTQAGWGLARKVFSKVGGPMPKQFTDVDKVNRQAVREYSMTNPPTPFDGRITVILARQTTMAGVDPELDPRLGWSRLAGKGIEVHHVSGNHLNMLESPHVEELAATLRACLDRAQGGEHGGER